MLGQVQSVMVAALCQVGEGAGGVGSQLQLGARHGICGRAMLGRPCSLGGCCCAVYRRCLQVPASLFAGGAATGTANSDVTGQMAMVLP